MNRSEEKYTKKEIEILNKISEETYQYMIEKLGFQTACHHLSKKDLTSNIFKCLEITILRHCCIASENTHLTAHQALEALLDKLPEKVKKYDKEIEKEKTDHNQNEEEE